MRDKESRIQTDLFRRARWLRFPGALEKSFLEYYHDKTILFIRFCSIFAISLYLANIQTDLVSFPELRNESLLIRLGFGFFGLIITAMTFLDRARRYLHPALFLISVYGSGGVVLFTLMGSGVYASLYHSGVMLCMVFTFAFVRLRFRPATLSGLIVTAGYIVPHAFMRVMPRDQLLHNSMNLVGTLLVGMCIAYLNEYHLRHAFVQDLIIDEKSRNLENRNRQIDRELEIAKSIQEKYMPAIRSYRGIGTLYQPMDRIGGDLFDILSFDDPDEVGIFISDVSGHGVPAALYTSMLRISLSQADGKTKNPRDLLVHLNEAMHCHVNNAFITCLYGILNRRTRHFRYASAGHNPPLVITAGAITPLPCPPSVPLTVYSRETIHRMNREYTLGETVLPAGSKLLFYTDGLTEARQPGYPDRMFEYNGMEQVILENCRYPAAEFTARLYQGLLDFRGSQGFEDDICVICVDIS